MPLREQARIPGQPACAEESSECRQPVIVHGDGFALEAVGYHESVIAALADEFDALRASRAGAIKAAVEAANNRAADAFLSWRLGGLLATMGSDEFAAWLRSGAPAPGAAPKDGG